MATSRLSLVLVLILAGCNGDGKTGKPTTRITTLDDTTSSQVDQIVQIARFKLGSQEHYWPEPASIYEENDQWDVSFLNRRMQAPQETLVIVHKSDLRAEVIPGR